MIFALIAYASTSSSPITIGGANARIAVSNSATGWGTKPAGSAPARNKPRTRVEDRSLTAG